MAPHTRSMHCRRDWSLCEKGILDLILQSLPYPDCSSFGKVCRYWRSVFVHRRKRGFQPPSLLLISNVGGSSLPRGIIHGGQLPSCFSSRFAIFPSNQIVGSGFGWLVIAGSFSPNIYLLNPTYDERILLPSFRLCFVVHVDLSSSPRNGLYVLVARVVYGLGQVQCLVRCSPGDRQWTMGIFQLQDPLQQCLDSVFHRYKLYVLSKNGDIVVCSIYPQPNIVFQVPINNFSSINPQQSKWLVQSNGELLFIVHQALEDQLRVFRRREEEGGGWVRGDNLGDQVLLIGRLKAESVCTKNLMSSTYEPNSIYYRTLNESVRNIPDRREKRELPC